MTQQQKTIADKWAGQSCTYQGKPAKICGRLLDYGTVAPLDPSVPSIEYSWEAIDRVMNNGRNFK